MAQIALSRRAFCAGLAGAAMARPARSRTADASVLTARKATVQLAPEGYGPTEVWSYDGTLPGPTIRAGQGVVLARRLVNNLDVPTSIHWHGIRIDNAMDGVAGLTQNAVPPGDSFDYAFKLPDAGTYWYHAHNNSMEQVARGLSGALIVVEPEAPDVDRDEVLMLGDWLLDPDTGGFMEPFGHPMTMSHGGRTGNLVGVNGRHDFAITARRNDRLRLRLINSANARIFVLRLHGMTGWAVALDGMPLSAPDPVKQEITLAPAQRIDLIVDITTDQGAQAGLLMWQDDDSWQMLAGIEVSGQGASAPRPAPAPLPPNPGMGLPDLSQARALDMVMEGGAMAGMESATYQGERLDFRSLAQRGQFWALSGQAGLPTTPFATLSRGEPVRIRLINRTAFPHAMHLHGTHFRELRADGGFGPLRDTILSLPDVPLDIAFAADNPGKWLFHCHMLAHAAAGMTTWINVI